MLGNEAMAGHVKALGWSDKLKPLPRKSVAGEIARIDARIGRIKQDYGVEVRHKYSHEEFIINYSTGNRYEDIAVLSDYVFVRKVETKDLMEAFPAIQRKVAVLVKYYQTISPDYDFSFYATPLREANTPSAQPAPPPPMKNH